MSQPTIVRSMKYQEWLNVGTELYGDDKKKWEFACPSCKLVMSFARYQHKSEWLTDWQPYSECVGRYLSDEGCDWAAYGLFSGPREIINDDDTHKSYVFYFAKEATNG